MKRITLSMLFLWTCLGLASVASAEQEKLDSPQATMFAFLEAINRVELKQGDMQENWTRVLATLDTSQVDPSAARYAARQLNEVIDKLASLKPKDLPDAKHVAARDIGRYVFFPDPRFTEVYEKAKDYGRDIEGRIVFEKGEDGQWRFNAETVALIGGLAQSLKPLPPAHAEQVRDGDPPLFGLVSQTFADTHLWQWGSLLLCIFLGLLAGKLVSIALRRMGDRLEKKQANFRSTLCHDLASPLSLALFTIGLMIGLQFIQVDPDLREDFVNRVVYFLFLLSVGWFAYNLIDLIEVALRRVTDKTENRIDDMVVPLIRKTLRIFLVIVFALVVAENVFGMDVTGFLAGLGIAGLAVSLAAQDSVKNLFGSLTVFFDKPFLVEDFIVFDGNSGVVEEIGFRSTRLRLLSGHLVTIPNMKFIDGNVENISLRPYIRRQMDVTITYDTPPEKIEQAVEILREILTDSAVVEQGMFNMEDNPPHVAFNELNADSLNIRAYYWYQIPKDSDRGFFTFLEHTQVVNMMLFKRYAEAGIEFAFPTQTLYLAGDENRQLTVNLNQTN